MSVRPTGQRRYCEYLNFEINRNPSWEEKNPKAVPFEEMIGYVVSRINDWKTKLDHIREPEVHQQLLDDFILYMSHQEKEDAQMTEKDQRLHQQDENADIDSTPGRTDHQNDMRDGLSWVQTLCSNTEPVPLTDEELLCDFHKVLMKHNSNDAGRLSKNQRYSYCVLKNETFSFPEPEIVKKILPQLCENINLMTKELFDAAKSKLDESLLTEIIRLLAWSVLSLVSLHPFGDGNGRWARLVFHYLHQILSPLPVSIYNVYSPTNRDDYIMALCSGRTENQVFSYNSKPSDLAAMILSCEYYTWKKYDEILSENPS